MILYDIPGPDAQNAVDIQAATDSGTVQEVTVIATKPWYLNGWVQLAVALGVVYYFAKNK